VKMLKVEHYAADAMSNGIWRFPSWLQDENRALRTWNLARSDRAFAVAIAVKTEAFWLTGLWHRQRIVCRWRRQETSFLQTRNRVVSSLFSHELVSYVGIGMF